MSQIPLHNYQEKAIDFAIREQSSFMMIDVGLGKTAIALKAIQQVGIPAIVFAPLRTATITWPEEIHKWTADLTYVVLYGPAKDKKLKYQRDIYLISYSSIEWFYQAVLDQRFRWRRFFLVLDESSMIKDPSTKRFKYIQKLSRYMSAYRLNLSATPNPNGWHELWSQYYVLDDGHRLGFTYESFRSKYFIYTGPPMYKTMVQKGAAEKLTDLISDITYRLAGEDYLELPELIVNKIALLLPPKLRKQYNQLEKDLCLQLEEVDITAFNAASLVMKLRQFLQGALYTDGKEYSIVHTIKVKALKDLIEIHSGSSILCAIQFKFEYDMIIKALGNVPIVAGRTTTKEAERNIKMWNDGQLPLLLCHPQSIGHGMNLQSGGNIILWYGLPWSLEQYIQLNGRLHRQGQKNAVVVNNLVFQDTVDQLILTALEDKDTSQQKLLRMLKLRVERSTLTGENKYDN